MSAMLVLSAVLAFSAQSITSTPGPDAPEFELREVAFDDLANGRPSQAVTALEQRLLDDPEDPATLINLGTAYQQVGQSDRAAEAYRAALDSKTRYKVELADGSWADSRDTARRGLAGVRAGTALAALDR